MLDEVAFLLGEIYPRVQIAVHELDFIIFEPFIEFRVTFAFLFKLRFWCVRATSLKHILDLVDTRFLAKYQRIV